MNINKYKSLGDAIGLPDKTDKERLQNIILKYEKEHPGEIKFHRDMARERIQNEFAEIDSHSARRYLMELPPGLHSRLESYIPTLFREKKHFSWFCRNFKELLIAEKY